MAEPTPPQGCAQGVLALFLVGVAIVGGVAFGAAFPVLALAAAVVGVVLVPLWLLAWLVDDRARARRAREDADALERENAAAEANPRRQPKVCTWCMRALPDGAEKCGVCGWPADSPPPEHIACPKCGLVDRVDQSPPNCRLCGAVRPLSRWVSGPRYAYRFTDPCERCQRCDPAGAVFCSGCWIPRPPSRRGL